MPPVSSADFEGLFRRLAASKIEFVVIGGVSAALQGVPLATYDLDIVLAPEAENLDRMFTLLTEIDACYREHLPTKRLVPERRDLESSGALLLMTSLGPLDILGKLSTGWAFDDLQPRTRTVALSDGLQLRILDLASLIMVKEVVGREKDRAVLPLYRRALKERELGYPDTSKD